MYVNTLFFLGEKKKGIYRLFFFFFSNLVGDSEVGLLGPEQKISVWVVYMV